MPRSSVTLTISLIALLSGHHASADLVTFTSEGSFLSSAPTTVMESFESLADRPLTTEPIATPGFTLSPLTTSVGIRSTSEGGTFATDGLKYVIFGDPNQAAAGELRFDFAAPITAFGLSVSDWGDIDPGNLSIMADQGEAASPITIASNPPQMPDGSLLFFGFIQDTPFTSVRLISTSPGDGLGIDEVYFTAVPEPSSVVSAALGLAALAGYAGWRRTRLAQS